MEQLTHHYPLNYIRQCESFHSPRGIHSILEEILPNCRPSTIMDEIFKPKDTSSPAETVWKLQDNPSSQM